MFLETGGFRLVHDTVTEDFLVFWLSSKRSILTIYFISNLKSQIENTALFGNFFALIKKINNGVFPLPIYFMIEFPWNETPVGVP